MLPGGVAAVVGELATVLSVIAKVPAERNTKYATALAAVRAI